MSRIIDQVRRYYGPLIVGFDATMWLVASAAAALLRYSRPGDIPWMWALGLGVACAVVYLVIGVPLRLHQGRARTASFDEFRLIGAVAGVTGVLVFLGNVVLNLGDGSRAVPLIAALAFMSLSMGGRTLWRQVRTRERLRAKGGTPALVVGAGDATIDLIKSMQRDPLHQWDPVGVIDDDPRNRHLVLEGRKVVGTVDQIPEKVRLLQAEAVILANPAADRELVRRVNLATDEAQVPLKTVPSTAEMLTDRVGIRDLRDINLTDVLGRNQLDTDVGAIAGYLRGKRVLVTGAGGSIGSELCRQINRFEPAELMMLDRDESALHAVSLSIHGRALLDGTDVVLADIRDVRSLYRIFTDRQPEVVFHAAALKHLPMLEQYPAEAIKTNIIGTRNVLDAALAVGVQRFVNISTDKAANPSSVLGYSKRIAERLTASYADLNTGASLLSVRFGNVLGSRGSVLTAFADQIAKGGPVTVTDPGVTRFFMTIEEACQLVIQAGAIGTPGEALVLDMGEPISILAVAEQLIEQSGRRIEIEFTGLRPGEKMHEELFADSEPQDVRPTHPLISHVPVPRIADDIIDSLPRLGGAQEVTELLARLCDEEQAPSPAPTAGPARTPSLTATG